MKKRIALILASVMVLTFSGCGKNDMNMDGADGNGSLSGKTFAMIGKDVSNPYMQKMFEGYEKACKEMGVKAIYRGPDQATPEKQIEIINQLTAQNVSVIAIAANDADALQPALKNAMDRGVKIVSVDSAVNKDSRMTHIQQADPEQLGREFIKAAHEMVDGNGGIAVLSATAQATNQNVWISWMEKELNENKEKYKDTPLIKIAYGDDDPTKSTSETNALLTNPNIKVIISPTTVGMLAAGKVLQDKGSDVKLTGLGLPSEMAQYIESGVCPWMYLWNPMDIGYLAAYTGKALTEGEATGKVGDKFDAGEMGEREITKALDGGTEVMLGDPYKFDKDNIGEWKNVY